MRTSRLVPQALLATWTLLVWVGRIRNVVADRTVSSSSRVLTLAMATTFVLAALALAWLVVRSSSDAIQRRVVGGLASLTTVVWVVRGADIAFGGDHPLGFVVVHLVLAVCSIALAWWAWRATNVAAVRAADDTPATVG